VKFVHMIQRSKLGKYIRRYMSPVIFDHLYFTVMAEAYNTHKSKYT